MPHILKINFNLSISVLPDDRIPDSFVHKMKHFLKKKCSITCSPTKSQNVRCGTSVCHERLQIFKIAWCHIN